jgi:hypothetical protein
MSRAMNLSNEGTGRFHKEDFRNINTGGLARDEDLNAYGGITHPWPLKTPDLRVPFEPPSEAWQRFLRGSSSNTD